ncbi:MAG: SDR family oxidoreductase [Bdellovibrionales bacterium]|nr:SDR family oxidoreductase [Bdellovibrionales bacterium]
MLAEDSLKNKVVLVTGGGSGLGLSMAQRFATLGADIAICGRNKDKLQDAVKSLSAHGTSVRSYQCDVREYDDVGKMVEQIVKDFGKLDSLVNNAAGNFFCTSEDLTPNGFKTVVDIVLHGTFNCTQHFGKQCIDSGRPGAVISIVTTYINTGSAFVLPSACAKAGVQALTTSLAYEWAPYGIRLNSIAPGPFPTKGAWSRLMPDGDFEEKFKKRHPMGRFGEPEELAELASFLLSDSAAYINGECVTIDGGQQLEGGQFNFIARMMPRKQLKQLFQAMKAKGA